MAQRLQPGRRAPAIVGGAIVGGCLATALGVGMAFAQPAEPLRFGGGYAQLEQRRQRLVDDLAVRFTKATGHTLVPAAFYDDMVSLSSKTTFDAVTHALMTTPLTDASNAPIGDALSLVERLDSVRGQIPGAGGDRQFRIYARLTADARGRLERSSEFKREGDNSVFHRGYPLNYREQGTPSIQISIALDGRQADIDVDYRSSSFPAALFNGHLSAENSDVRAGDNVDRHAARWSGFQNWWRSFFGVRLEKAPDDPDASSPLALPKVPRAGRKNIDVMAYDFLHAWLIEGDIVAAMGYISDRAYSCLAQEAADPAAFDRGVAPYRLMTNLKAARDELGAHDTLAGLTVGVRLAIPALKVVRQPHHAQFVLYSVPDDVAAGFDCDTRSAPPDRRTIARTYGNFFGSTFFVAGRHDQRVALLWAKDGGYWKIVAWKIGVDDDDAAAPAVSPEVRIVHVKDDPTLVDAARDFLDAWLIRKDYAAAFGYLSTSSYACYDLARSPDQPASTSREDAGRKLRASLERAGTTVGPARSLESVVVAAEPTNPAIRLLDHRYARTFTLTSIPTAIGDAVECDARARHAALPEPVPLDYGDAFAMGVRFSTASGEAPVLRLLWRKEDGAWRIRAYDVELP